MSSCKKLYRLLSSQLSQEFPCELVDDSVCVETPIMFPDGHHVGVYIREVSGQFIISDRGEMWTFLLENGIPPSLSQARKDVLDNVLLTTTTMMGDDEIYAIVTDPDEIPFALFRVAQAVSQASNLVYSKRVRLPDTFNDRVYDFLVHIEVEFRESVPVTDPFGKTWLFDFRVDSGSKRKLVKTLATDSATYAEQLITRAIRQWDAVKPVLGETLPITIIGDEPGPWREASLAQLSRHSRILPFSRRDQFVSLLTD